MNNKHIFNDKANLHGDRRKIVKDVAPLPWTVEPMGRKVTNYLQIFSPFHKIPRWCLHHEDTNSEAPTEETTWIDQIKLKILTLNFTTCLFDLVVSYYTRKPSRD